MNYYQRIRDIREDNDIKQLEIAEMLNIKQSDYSKYELGKHMMGIDKYIKLAKYYNVSLDYLAGIIDTPRPLNENKVIETKTLTQKEKKLLNAYKDNPQLQAAIDKLLDLEI